MPDWKEFIERVKKNWPYVLAWLAIMALFLFAVMY